MNFLLLHFAALLPAGLILWRLRARHFRGDDFVLAAAFLVGALSVIPIWIGVELWNAAGLGPEGLALVPEWAAKAFLAAALPEEGVRLAVMVLFCARQPEFRAPESALALAGAASLGFASLENVFYVFGNFDSWVGTSVVRALLCVPGHCGFGLAMGFFVWRALADPARRGQLLVLAFGVAFLLHGAYDFMVAAFEWALRAGPSTVSAGQGLGLGALLLLSAAAAWASGILALRAGRAWRRRSALATAEGFFGLRAYARLGAASWGVGAFATGFYLTGILALWSEADFEPAFFYEVFMLAIMPLAGGIWLHAWAARQAAAGQEAVPTTGALQGLGFAVTLKTDADREPCSWPRPQRS